MSHISSIKEQTKCYPQSHAIKKLGTVYMNLNEDAIYSMNMGFDYVSSKNFICANNIMPIRLDGYYFE